MGAGKRPLYECHSCGVTYPKWQGQCSDCGAWNSLVESTICSEKLTKSSLKPVSWMDVSVVEVRRFLSGIDEFDRVLGGGLVQGSVVLLGGEPGVGKSTLAVQLAQQLSQRGQTVLYISAEESVEQVYLRAKRVGEGAESLHLISASDMVGILSLIREMKPDIVILDSIQTVSYPGQGAVSGSVSQVRYCAQELVQCVKALSVSCIVIGHVTKDGQLAGPKVLEHLVDVTLCLEGDDSYQFRLLRCFKNRYASTREIGVFDMVDSGLVEVKNTAALFMEMASCSNPGSVISGIVDGHRVFLVEVQALVVSSGYGMAKRTCLGVDANRATVMIATLEKMLGFKMASKDVVLNVIGGMRVREPALDLAMILAMGSSLLNVSFGRSGVLGEVGVTGEVRSIPHLTQRLDEFEKLGFTRVIGPALKKGLPNLDRLRYYGVAHVREAFGLMKGWNEPTINEGSC